MPRLNSKTCKRCNVVKPLSSFEKLPRGIRGVCHRCRSGKAPLKTERRFQRQIPDSRRYLITCAQNATPVDGPFFKVLQVAAKHLGAQVVVVPLRYKNPTSLWSQKQETDDWWDPQVEPFLCDRRVRLNPNLVLAADVRTQPTATSPLTGFEALTGGESCIIGHPKMQLRTVPVPSGRYPKILTTTGACTRRNYSPTKAGKIGEFHHFLGAVLVEISGKTFHLRQINAHRGDGSFTDLDQRYSLEGVSKAPPALGLVCGDTHVRATSSTVDRATFGPRGIVATIDPRTIVLHDLFDGASCNPHETGNPFIGAARRLAGQQDVRAEVTEAVTWIQKRAGDRHVVVVDSNHHAFLSRWVISSDWKHDLRNAAFYLETAQAMLASARVTERGPEYLDPFPYWARKLGARSNVRCLGPDEGFKLGSSECGLHGHQGPNGTRGSIRNLSRLGSRVISGHGHSAGIEGGHYRVGTSTARRQSYQHGPSSNLNTHCLIYSSGARCLITILDDGAWRLS